ncbi:MAG TPA: DUF6265 family protein [Acidobacteriota bacterium]
MVKRTKRGAVSLVITGVIGLSWAESALAQQTAPTDSAASLERIAWLAGVWHGDLGAARMEEHWIPAEGQLMLGVSRTLAGGRTAAFEFLRIEAREDDIFYIAQPGGRPPTEFKATRLLDREVVFENPAHDHPKIIRYRLDPGGALIVQIEGDECGEHLVQNFQFRRRL